ncbi:MAG: hypothetical protein WCH98_17285 [Verrucomicrobiota bacterium]
MNAPSLPRCMSSLKILAAAALLATSFQAQAANITWSNNGTVWLTGTNWLGGVAPANNATTDTAVFNSVTFTNPTPGSISIAGIIVGDGATSTGNLSFTNGGETIGANGITVKGNGSSAIGQVQMNALTINGSQTWTNNGYVSANTTAGLKTGTITTTANSGNVTLTLAGNGTSGNSSLTTQIRA